MIFVEYFLNGPIAVHRQKNRKPMHPVANVIKPSGPAISFFKPINV